MAGDTNQPPLDLAGEAAAAAARRLLGPLERLPPRAARALTLRLVEGRSREECAGFFGIAPEAFDVMLLRATDALLIETAPSPIPPAPAPAFAQELATAKALADALESRRPPSDAEQARRWRCLSRLRALAPHLLAEMEATSRAEESAPRSRREALLRKGLLLLLAGAAIYLYARAQPGRDAPDRPRARPAASPSPPRTGAPRP